MCASMKLDHLILQDIPVNDNQKQVWKWHIQDPASQRLTWNKPPQSVLVIKKIQDASLLQPFKELCVFLTKVKNMIVYVEKKALEDPAISGDENFGAITKNFCTFREDLDDISNLVDFIICLGGDGTLLYASSLFQESVPPVMAFHLGSLGFLTPFKFETYQSQVTQVIEGNAAIVLRSRLKVRVFKENREKKARVDDMGIILTNGDVDCGRKVAQYQVLNEVVVDRGPSSYPLQRGPLSGRTPHYHRAGRRRDRFYTNRKYSVRSGSRSVHDSSQRPRHHDHPYLPSLPLL
ncbi:hypothetical protein fugu_006573 [Takifugu bimaculatus]|uniref:NAD(+) kinase n=1 Tax=Takifugu bimaculatus TaxID=433685 RepID=A0A4Z2B1X1_9TELE|nr:hypothetical protein fugu_006573 [Takifugu bimaculatus]